MPKRLGEGKGLKRERYGTVLCVPNKTACGFTQFVDFYMVIVKKIFLCYHYRRLPSTELTFIKQLRNRYVVMRNYSVMNMGQCEAAEKQARIKKGYGSHHFLAPI